MSYFENVHSEICEGFEIVFSVAPEDTAPDWDFESDEEREELIKKIHNGNMAWFIARVEAKKEGLSLGVDYLGGCCYESAQDFVNANDYYTDMKASAIKQAKATIKKLCEGATK